jgi:hypothetical protein
MRLGYISNRLVQDGDSVFSVNNQEPLGMCQRHPRRISVKDCLRLLIKLDPFVSKDAHPCTFQHILHLIASVKGKIQYRFFGSRYTQKKIKKIVRIITRIPSSLLGLDS